MRLPQIFAILQAGNSTGLSVKAYWMDLAACLIGFSYGYAHGYHLTTYMEAGLIAIQVSTIIFLVILYDRKWTLENGLYTLLCAVYIVISSLKLLPHPLLSALLSSTLPLAVLSKLTHKNSLPNQISWKCEHVNVVIGYLLVCGSTLHCVCGSRGLADSC